MNVNFMKVHQPNMPAPEYIHKSLSKSKYADSVVELDARIGRIMDKVRALGLDKNTLVFYTTDNGAWQDVYPDAGYTPFRGTKGTVREGGNRVPAIAWWPGKIDAGHEEPRHPRRPRPDGDLRLGRRHQAAGEGPRGQADHLRQLRHVAGPVRHRQVGAQDLVLLHRERADARAPRASATTRRCSICAATTAPPTGGLAVDSNLGWKGAEKYVATVPAGLRPLAGPAGALRHLHEQLHRAHLDPGHDQRGDQGADEDLRPISAAQAAERGLHRARSRSRSTSASRTCGRRSRRRASRCRCPAATNLAEGGLRPKWSSPETHPELEGAIDAAF